jgi:hypothetical protein
VKVSRWRDLVLPAWRYYNSAPEKNCGGHLHIVLDDGNTETSHVLFCLRSAEEDHDAEGVALARLLLSASLTQRDKLYDHYHLYASGAPMPVDPRGDPTCSL